jgi:hypothetical protein
VKQIPLQELDEGMKLMQIDSNYSSQNKYPEDKINAISLLDMNIEEACTRKFQCQMVQARVRLLSSDNMDAFLNKVIL